MNHTSCSCGNTEAHLIATRKTFDGMAVQFWSDGGVTGAMGYAIKGVGISRSDYGRRLAVRAAWLVAGDVELYDFSEVKSLVLAARNAVRYSSLDEVARADMRGQVA